jgi:PBP4 family serine-type D-alanyl-D-alanine carboxypeptidase
MDRDSDNFRAEMLLKELGAEAGTGGSSDAGAAVVRRVLAEANVPLAGVVIADGSGLSLLDRLTATTIARILTTAWSDPTLKAAFWAALPAAGEQGTLEHRLKDPPALGVVRAKTGTTNEASALSGYVRDRFAFVVVQNGDPVSATAARKAQDRFATALARVSASE